MRIRSRTRLALGWLAWTAASITIAVVLVSLAVSMHGFTGRWEVELTAGMLRLADVHPGRPYWYIPGGPHTDAIIKLQPPRWWPLDLRLQRVGGRPEVLVPLWIPGLLLTIAALSLVRPELALFRKGLCQSCGYPVRGLPPTAPCPECGNRTPGPST